MGLPYLRPPRDGTAAGAEAGARSVAAAGSHAEAVGNPAAAAESPREAATQGQRMMAQTHPPTARGWANVLSSQHPLSRIRQTIQKVIDTLWRVQA